MKLIILLFVLYHPYKFLLVHAYESRVIKIYYCIFLELTANIVILIHRKFQEGR